MIMWWHSLLDMHKYDEAWHRQDLADEIREYYEERNWLKKWSELSDVVYTCTRGRWSGHVVEFPFSKGSYVLGTIYMLPKYTGRYLFFRRAGKRAGAKTLLREVRNPRKTHKLHTIANRYDIDPELFQRICEKQLRYWKLLP